MYRIGRDSRSYEFENRRVNAYYNVFFGIGLFQVFGYSCNVCVPTTFKRDDFNSPIRRLSSYFIIIITLLIWRFRHVAAKALESFLSSSMCSDSIISEVWSSRPGFGIVLAIHLTKQVVGKAKGYHCNMIPNKQLLFLFLLLFWYA